MPVRLISDSKELKVAKKPALKLIEVIKKLNFKNAEFDLLKIMNIENDLSYTLSQFKSYYKAKGVNLNNSQCFEKFIELAYENGVKNDNPFIANYYKAISSRVNDLQTEMIQVSSNKEMFKDIVINQKLLGVTASELKKTKNLLSEIKRNANYIIRKSDNLTTANVLRVNTIVDNVNESYKIIRSILKQSN